MAPTSWTPAPGTFANIGNNTLLEARPSSWPNGDSAGPFANWSGAVFAPDFSRFGALAVHGSGHLTPNTPTWAGVWCFDLDDLTWKGRNVPSQPLLEGAYYNAHGESTDAQTAGHPYPPHTYDGLVYQPAAQGGGGSGSLLRVAFAGAPYKSAVHRFDLSSTNAPPMRVIDDIMQGAGGRYPATTLDIGRGGFWFLAGNGNGPLKFVRFSDWSITNFPGIEFNVYGNVSLVHIPAPWDCLVGVGEQGSFPDLSYAIRVSRLGSGTPQAFFEPSWTGTRAKDMRAGAVWSTLLNCLVLYEGGGSTLVHKLVPPAPTALAGGTWTLTNESLNGVGGAVPSKGAANGAWSRFVEVPEARCFLWCDNVSQPMQAWRLSGM